MQNFRIVAVMFLTCIWEMPSSNHSQDIVWAEVFVVLFSLQENARIVP
jgi:hypothetical protein